MATTRKRSKEKQPSTRQVRFAAGIENPQNAIALLKGDHREVEGFFKSFKRSDSAADKQVLAKKICDALKLHARIEEEIFYPAFIQATGAQQIHDEAIVEHDGAKKLIADIEGGAAGDPLFDAKVTVLAEMIKHHVREEERFGGMFSKARMAKMDLLALGALLEARKRELVREPSAKRAKTPRGTRSAFMGAAQLSRSVEPRPRARRNP
jgi:hypothetical protein